MPNMQYGYFDSLPLGLCQHTFVKVTDLPSEISDQIDSSEIYFDCYGIDRIDKKNHKLSPPQPLDSNSLSQAIAIACGDENDKRAVYDHPLNLIEHTTKRFGLLGDCSGLIYGVTGVCHQMANRLLWTGKIKLTIHRVPSLWWTVPLWGKYGKPLHWDAWDFPHPFVENVMKDPCEDIMEDLMELMGQAGLEINDEKQKALVEIHKQFLHDHKNLVVDLIREEKAPGEYAKKVNENIPSHLEKISKLFAEKEKNSITLPDQGHQIIDPHLMERTFEWAKKTGRF